MKRLYEPPAPEDGARFLVERLWPHGIKKASLPMDAWLKEVAPTSIREENLFRHKGDCDMETYTHEWLCRQIVENTQEAIIYADRDGMIRFWNMGAETIFGYTASEVLGQSLELIIPERLRDRHREGYRRVMATGITQYDRKLLAVPATRKDGAQISLEFTVTLIRGAEREILGIAAVLRDVTARWEREKAMREHLAAMAGRA